MDNITHALAGLLLADITTEIVAPRRAILVTPRFRRAAVITGIVAAELPDADLLYAGPLLGMGKLGYLLHHRGHTHTVLWALAAALVLWLSMRWWLGRRSEAAADAMALPSPATSLLLGLALAGALSHLLLDWTNSYGVHPFWPIDNRWYYGDAVFIVEPWLWLLAIPALFWGARRRAGRVLLALLLMGIIAAMWGLGQVAPSIAAVGSVVAAVGMVMHRRLLPTSRIALGVLLWTGATVVFASSGAMARAQVAGTIPSRTLRDVMLNPAPGDPTCWRAMAVTDDGLMYRVSTAVVAPWPNGQGAHCATRYRSGRLSGDALEAMPDVSLAVPFDTTGQAVQWQRTWAAPRAELVALASERCEFAVALRFMRIPIWREDGAGVVHLSDARFGMGRGFADLEIPPRPTPCSLGGGRFPPWIPPWDPPRGDVLRGGT